MKLKATTPIFKVWTYRELIAHQQSYYSLIIMLSVIPINLIIYCRLINNAIVTVIVSILLDKDQGPNICKKSVFFCVFLLPLENSSE